MSIVGPLVTPNTLETRFDRTAFLHAGRHRVLTILLILAIAAGAAFAAHIVPDPF